MKKEAIKKPWTLSYAVEYRTQALANDLRAPIRTMLEVFSALRGIDFLLSERPLIEPSLHYSVQKSPDSGLVDFLYFRSTPQTTMTSKDFQTLMALIFRGREWVDSSSDFAVFARTFLGEDPWRKLLD